VFSVLVVSMRAKRNQTQEESLLPFFFLFLRRSKRSIPAHCKQQQDNKGSVFEEIFTFTT
jgi:hypothetical protein